MMAERAERMNKRRRTCEESSVTGTEIGVGVGSGGGGESSVTGIESSVGVEGGVGVGSGVGGESRVHCEQRGPLLCLSDIEDESACSTDEEESFDEEKAQNCLDDWVLSLPATDRKMLSVALTQTFLLRQRMKVTDAVREAASFVGFNEKTVRKYRKEYFACCGHFPEEKRGKYKRDCLITNEDIKLKAAMWVRENSYKKGATNMTAASFCSWVNDTLLLQHDLPANLPRRISLRTATRWLHHLGFRPCYTMASSPWIQPAITPKRSLR